ncbi:MAG TPA: hypothetical protein VIL72_10505 [Beijerinckiaceae bacterium]|jgi:tripartite-type tricarboxylate transporter receptor subunit TctC
MKRTRVGARAAAFMTACAMASWTAAPAAPARAESAPPNLQIVVGHEAGTGFDLYARTLARFMPAHLPGKPTAVVQNMNGASGLTAFNWLANVAPKDGSVIATATFTVPFEPLLGNAAARFEAAKLTWIGNMDSSVSICGVSKASGVRTFEDALKRETLLGSTGQAGPLSQSPRALNELLGARFKIIEGYKGSASVKLAIERGEVQGVCGISLSTVKTQYRDVWDAGDFRLILQIGPAPHPDIKDVPHVYDFARDDEERAVFDVLFGSQGLGRSFVAPPGVPAERAEALRRAFDATMRDEAFLKEAEKIGLDIRPQSGAEVQAFIERVHAAPPAVAARARKALGR